MPNQVAGGVTPSPHTTICEGAPGNRRSYLDRLKFMKTLIPQLLLVSLLITTGCDRSGDMPFSYTVSPSGSITMSIEGTGKKVEIVTKDYELMVNGVPYGRIDDRDVITVINGDVYRNGVMISPATEKDRTVDQTAEQGVDPNA